jgi:cell division protein FtsB
MRHRLIAKKRSWFHSPMVAVFLILCCIWGIIAVIKAYAKQREAVSFRDQYRREAADLRQKEDDLGQKIQDLSTDRGIETEVRNRYRVSRPGEQLVVVVDNGHDEVASPKPSLWAIIRQFVGW